MTSPSRHHTTLKDNDEAIVSPIWFNWLAFYHAFSDMIIIENRNVSCVIAISWKGYSYEKK